MSASDTTKGLVRIRGADALTEVRVLDAHFEAVSLTSNTGNVDVELNPGIYQVGFRRGGEWSSRQVLLPVGKKSVSVKPPKRTAFFERSELPDLVTHRATDAANVIVELEQFDRTLLGRDAADRMEVSLVGPEGDATRPFHPMSLVPGTWRFFVHPGNWRLRINETAARPTFELPITVCPGWIVQIACSAVHKPEASPGSDADELAIDLERLRVRMVSANDPQRGFSPEMLAREESALASLASGYPLFGDDFENFLNESFREKLCQPMIGIYAGHILCSAWRERQAPIDDILDNLDRWTRMHPEEPFEQDAVPHPDVEALKLRYRLLRGQSLEDVAPLPFPPSLMAGWKALLEAARQRPDLIPCGSVTERVSTRLWSTRLWVAWSADALETPLEAAPRAGGPGPRALATPPPEPAIDFETARDVIVSGLSHAVLRGWYRQAETQALEQERSMAALTPGMLAVANALRPVLGDEDKEALMQRVALTYPQVSRPPDLVALAAQLSLPMSKVAAAASSLATTLLEQANLLGLDLSRRTSMARPEITIPYDPSFLGDGFVVPMPTLGETARSAAFADGAVIDYIHYSLVMHGKRRVALLTANNIDAAKKVSVAGGLTWQMDERVGEYQIGRETYDRNQIDKGHLVRREDVLWGTVAEARAANRSTYFYTNAAPQHQNFNQDEWKCLEDWVLQRATDLSYRLCVFTGPVLTDEDPTLEDLPPELRTIARSWGPAQLPAAFWKVIVLRDAEAGGSDLAAIAFAMKQSEMWNDKHGRRLLNLELHQVTLEAIEAWTGLDFGALRDVDELAYSPVRTVAGEEAPWPTVKSASDIVWSGPERRARGLRARPRDTGGVAERRLVDQASSRSTDCCQEDFDARVAIETLSRDVARLAGLMAQSEASSLPAAAGPRGVGGDGDEDPRLATEDDPRVEAMVAAAPESMRARIRVFARTVVGQSDIARGLRPVPAPRELERIVGGQNVPLGGFPHCVCIGEPSRWMCTGVLVAPQVVLTAAHCGSAINRIMVGQQVSPGLSADARVVAVQRVAVHPDYRPYPFSENDITVLILAAPALAPPASLAREQEIAAASAVELVGFGYNDPQRPIGFGVKRQVTIDLPPILRGGQQDDMAQLESLLGFHGEYEFVVGRKTLGRDSCNGDSGGPAYIKVGNEYRVAGITSRATREAVANCGDGGIYVRPEYFRPWIDGIVAASGIPPINW